MNHNPPIQRKSGQQHVEPSSNERASLGKSMQPPQFKLESSPANGYIQRKGDSPETESLLLQAGFCRGELEMMEPCEIETLAETSEKWPGRELSHVYRILSRNRMEHGVDPVMNAMLGNGDWATDPGAESLGRIRECRYRNAEGQEMSGFMEIVKQGNDPGIRAVVPYGNAPGAFGGDVILRKSTTTTVLGRFIDEAAAGSLQVAVNAEAGTNFFRFQPNFQVGKSHGGGNVLSITDWTLEKNVEWLKAAIRRGDQIRFISDPTLLSNLYYGGNVINGITITGIELGVLLMHGLAPGPDGIVVPIDQLEEGAPSDWNQVVIDAKIAISKMKVDGKDHTSRFENESAETDLSPLEKTDRNTNELVKQTNLFNR